MARALQHRASTFLAGLSPTRAGSDHTEGACATGQPRPGRPSPSPRNDNPLKFRLDHSMGAGQPLQGGRLVPDQVQGAAGRGWPPQPTAMSWRIEPTDRLAFFLSPSTSSPPAEPLALV